MMTRSRVGPARGGGRLPPPLHRPPLAQDRRPDDPLLVGAQLKKYIDATLGSGNLREAVRQSIGEDINEWLAVNTVDFFNQVNLLFGTLMEFCTPTTCPTMSAGPNLEYKWTYGVKIKKPIEVSAPKYVEYLMKWINSAW